MQEELLQAILAVPVPTSHADSLVALKFLITRDTDGLMFEKLLKSLLLVISMFKGRSSADRGRRATIEQYSSI